MKTSTLTIVTGALTAVIGTAVFTNFSSEEISVDTGYSFFTKNAVEQDTQKTIVAPDGHKFTIALNLLEIEELDRQYELIIDEECTSLDCSACSESGSTVVCSDNCRTQIECENENLANAEKRENILENQDELLKDIVSAKKELNLDVDLD